MIYLDHNATTPVAPEVVAAMLPYFHHDWANPSSSHPGGQRARAGVETARRHVAALFGGAPEGVVFTSCGTEASNLAIRGVRPGHVVSTTVEHPATLAPVRLRDHTLVAVQSTGSVLVEDVLAAVRDDTVLVSVMHANNETGAINPVNAIGEALPDHVLMHVDAAQSLGKIPVSVEGIDLLTIAGHKLYAPKGIGALWIRPGTHVAPLLLGGGQERGLRPGTENVPYIVGLGHACRIAGERLTTDADRVGALRDELREALESGIPGLRTNGEPGLPNTLNVSLPGVLGSTVLASISGLAASTGSACHAGVPSPSPVLTAMGLSAEDALGAIRLSLGRTTSRADIANAAVLLCEAWRRHRS